MLENILGLKAACGALGRHGAMAYDLQQALGDLVAKACSKRAISVAPEHLSGIKALCRASDANVQLAFDLLYQRLKQPHSQVGRMPRIQGSCQGVIQGAQQQLLPLGASLGGTATLLQPQPTPCQPT